MRGEESNKGRLERRYMSRKVDRRVARERKRSRRRSDWIVAVGVEEAITIISNGDSICFLLLIPPIHANL
jgi:hypothetical protein